MAHVHQAVACLGGWEPHDGVHSPLYMTHQKQTCKRHVMGKGGKDERVERVNYKYSLNFVGGGGMRACAIGCLGQIRVEQTASGCMMGRGRKITCIASILFVALGVRH